MKSRITIFALIAMLGIVMASFSGGLMAGEDSGKACPHGSEKVEGKCCGEVMCKKIQDHQAAMATAAEKMAEHLDAIREIQSDEEWRVEVEKHLAMVQKYVEEMQNCPMGNMWHEMKHGEKRGEGHGHGEGHGVGSGSK